MGSGLVELNLKTLLRCLSLVFSVFVVFSFLRLVSSFEQILSSTDDLLSHLDSIGVEVRYLCFEYLRVLLNMNFLKTHPNFRCFQRFFFCFNFELFQKQFFHFLLEKQKARPETLSTV